MSNKWVLKNIFGHKEFRGLQGSIVEHIISGKDALVLMPTGFGKSLCYQMPALIREGVTVVISPLLSLMKDQVDALSRKNISACTLNSTQSPQENRELEADIVMGKYKIVYVSPERSLKNSFIELLKNISLGLIAIDEAHCISEWGHDFRPQYRDLEYLRFCFPQVPIVALTATASRRTCKDIVETLNLTNSKVFISGFDRPNIEIIHERKTDQGMKLFRKVKNLIAEDGATLIYCLSRKNVESVYEYFLSKGLSCEKYHGGMVNEERVLAQEYFLTSEKPLMIATNAFGMGIDRADVRTVIHLDMPSSLESYYQEIGRAGRDGEQSKAIMFYSPRDAAIHKMMARKSSTDKNHLLLEYERIDKMLWYSESPSCKRFLILKHFSEEGHCHCDTCSSCLQLFHHYPVTDFAFFLLKEINILMKKNSTVYYYDFLDHLAGQKFNGEFYPRATWKRIFGELYLMEAIQILPNQGKPLIMLTNGALDIIHGKIDVSLVEQPKPLKKIQRLKKKRKTRKKVEKKAAALPNDLYSLLVRKRAELANKRGVPAYKIFHNETLENMARLKPKNREEMLSISGVGPKKWSVYGKDFLKTIQGSGEQL